MSSLIRWSPMYDPFQEMEEVMKSFPMISGSGQMARSFVPAMDMYETKDAVMVETPLPGVDPKNVEVSVEKGVLTVRGESKHEHEIDEKNYYRKEVRSGSFFRQLALPVPVKEDAVRAEFADGVLKITCPKTEVTRAKKVNVQIVKKNDKK